MKTLEIVAWIFLGPAALVFIGLLFTGVYIAVVMRCEDKKAAALKRREESMSWSKTFEGDVEKVVGGVEEAVESAASVAEKKAHTIVADIAKELQDLAGAGKKLLLRIGSAGHFNTDGTGSATINITSNVAPAAQTPPPRNGSKGGSMTVSVGRIVRFVASEKEICAAIVAKVWDESNQCVNLAVIRDNGNVSGFTSVLPDPNKSVGTWHWPEIAKEVPPTS